MTSPAAPPPPPLPTALPQTLAAEQRFGPTHQLILLLTVLGLGTGLFAAGTPMRDVLALLGGCGAIGAATAAALSSSRRLVRGIVEAAVRAAAGR